MKMIDSMGWLGNLMLAVCAVPQAWASYKQGHSKGISSGMLLLWGVGTLLALPLQVDKGIIQAIVNYTFNLMMISIIVYYKLKPR
jgi:uncharacterized protein with PQ loop repeat